MMSEQNVLLLFGGFDETEFNIAKSLREVRDVGARVAVVGKYVVREGKTDGVTWGICWVRGRYFRSSNKEGQHVKYS